MGFDLKAIPSPVILRGDDRVAYRDPAAHYHDGVFRVFHTEVHREDDGRYFLYTAVILSTDLVNWSEPRIITPRDQRLNFSSPGNVIRRNGQWIMCLQTYPTPENQPCGDQTARVFTMRSKTLESWSEPDLIRVNGPDVPIEDMARMIDPYLVEDIREPGKWWCFYKQRGASMSWTRDFTTWTYHGHVDAGENACVLTGDDEYILVHSPRNGIGFRRSPDLINWTNMHETTLGEDQWKWAGGRITAGHVLDMRGDPAIQKYVMFFHGSTPEGTQARETHGNASIGIAWSDDLVNWQWPQGSTGAE
jgi:hypothetical protein